jgi:hypothetical protein
MNAERASDGEQGDMADEMEPGQRDGVYNQDLDNNFNGIPDREERDLRDQANAAANDRTFDWNEHIASTSPFERPVRGGQAHLGGTYDPSDANSKDRDSRRSTDEANKFQASGEKKAESDTGRLSTEQKYRRAAEKLQLRRLAANKAKKPNLIEGVAASKNVRDENSGLELGKEFYQGLLLGVRNERDRKMVEQKNRDAQAAEEILARQEVEDILDASKEKRDASETGKPSDGVDPGDGGGAPPGSGPDNPGGGKDPSGDKKVEPEVETAAPTPANENSPTEPLRETGRAGNEAADAPEVVHARDRAVPTVDGVERPDRDPRQTAATDRAEGAPQATTTERDAVAPQGAAKDVHSEPAKAKQEAPAVQPAKTVVGKTAAGPGKSVDPAEATGNAGMGMAVSVVNPVAGVALASVQARESQKEAGQEFRGATKAKGPEDAKAPAGTAVSVSGPKPLPQGERRLGTITPQEVRSNVVSFRKPIVRESGLAHQAASLPRPAQPAVSKGPAAPVPRVRVMGLGSGIASIIAGQREPQRPNDQSVEMQAAYQRQRNGGGREK